MGISINKIIFLTLIFFSTSLFANVAKVVALKGNASILRQGEIIQLTRESLLLRDDQITTKDNTKVQLLFKDETIISIGKNSSFYISDYLFDEKNKKYEAKFNMFKGTFKTITGKIGKISPQNFNLKTKTASIGIRGTQIVMNLSKNKEEIFCTEGKILVTKLDSKISSIVNAGEFTSFTNQNNEKIEIKKIKNSDIKKINESIVIQNNLATDRITIKEDGESINIPLLNQDPNPKVNQTLDPNFNPDKLRKDRNMKKEDFIQEEIDKVNSNDNFGTEEEPISIENITPHSYFNNDNSTVTYKGDFNNYTYDNEKQYFKADNSDTRSQIPTDTTISMDIDFEATSEQISNGKINVKDIGGGTSESLLFRGSIQKSTSTFNLQPDGSYHGAGGDGTFYGSEANVVQGNIELKSNTSNIEINGDFEAKKQ